MYVLTHNVVRKFNSSQVMFFSDLLAQSLFFMIELLKSFISGYKIASPVMKNKHLRFLWGGGRVKYGHTFYQNY